jgi:hypothetical protein
MTDHMRKSSAASEEFREGAGGKDEYPGPSTGPAEGGLEGSVIENEGTRASGGERSTGAGGEAAEGMHASKGRDQTDKSGVTNRSTGVGASGLRERAGSEPLDRQKEHKGSYGGEGGDPRTSSDQREKP